MPFYAVAVKTKYPFIFQEDNMTTEKYFGSLKLLQKYFEKYNYIHFKKGHRIDMNYDYSNTFVLIAQSIFIFIFIEFETTTKKHNYLNVYIRRTYTT